MFLNQIKTQANTRSLQPSLFTARRGQGQWAGNTWSVCSKTPCHWRLLLPERSLGIHLLIHLLSTFIFLKCYHSSDKRNQSCHLRDWRGSMLDSIPYPWSCSGTQRCLLDSPYSVRTKEQRLKQQILEGNWDMSRDMRFYSKTQSKASSFTYIWKTDSIGSTQKNPRKQDRMH